MKIVGDDIIFDSKEEMDEFFDKLKKNTNRIILWALAFLFVPAVIAFLMSYFF